MHERSPRNGAHTQTPVWLLAFAGALSLLASACCVLPLLLVALGFSAAWLVPVRWLTSYWPLLIVGAIVALVLAKRRITCERAICVSNDMVSHTLIFWVIVTWTGVVLLAPLLAPLFY
jgi:mercuric ion transport protein